MNYNFFSQTFHYQFSHPLDQFEIFALWFYWSGIGLPVGLTIITNLTIILWFNIILIRILLGILYVLGGV